MWITSLFIPFIFVTGITGDVSHLKDLENKVIVEKVPVPLLTNDLPSVPSIEPLELPKPIQVITLQEEVNVATPVSEDVPITTEVPTEIKIDDKSETHLPLLASPLSVPVQVAVPVQAAVPEPSFRSLNFGEVDPGFSRPILPGFGTGRSLNLADPIILPAYFTKEFQFKQGVLPEKDYLPPVQNNDLQNEYLPPDSEYLPPQARNQGKSLVIEAAAIESDKITVNENTENDETNVDITTITPELVVETTEIQQEEIASQEPEVPEAKSADLKIDEVEGSDSIIVTKHGKPGHDEVVVLHNQRVPEKIEIIPSSGYFYPKPRVLFLYK